MITLDTFYIDGDWVAPDSTETMPILSPATNRQVGTVAMGNAADVDRAVQAAKRAFETFSMTSKEERLALLRRLAEVTRARMDDLAHAMTTEMGAPRTMSRAVQADAAIGHLEAFIAALERLERKRPCPTATS